MFPRMSRLCHRMAEAKLHNFLFADISGYSRLSELGGDEVAADVAIRFASLAGGMAPEHGASVVKRVGDAVMVHSTSAADLIALGLRLHEELGSLPPIHVGIHSGRAVERAGDWWGCTVNIAARIANAAGAGQLLVTDQTRRAAGHRCPASLRGLGKLQLKNISVPVQVYEAVPRLVVPTRKRSARRQPLQVPELAPQLSLFERDRVPAGALAFEGLR
jgi:adenylate cyclase